MLQNKIQSKDDLARILQQKQVEGKRIVFTNGCFDILHAGHVLYLAEARALGDILVLGLNSDASVKRLKGAQRPINGQFERAVVLAALESVSYVCIFEEDTPYELIKALQPDILVKGGDWNVADIVGSDLVLARGGEVKSLSFSQGLSTTNVIQKIQREGK